MKRERYTCWMLAFATIGLLVGCGSNQTTGARYELRLRGINTSSYNAAIIGIRDVLVTAHGQPLPVQLQPATRAMDLAKSDLAYVVGYFFVPEQVNEVDISAQFNDFGGYERRDSAGSIDGRAPALSFHASVGDLKLHGHAVVQIDLDKSLLPSARRSDERMLLANTVVAY